jgi:threonine aldolase
MEFNSDTGTLQEFKAIGRDTLGQVKDKVDEYLSLAGEASGAAPNPHRSEYVGEGMASAITRYTMDRYLGEVAAGRLNTEHGYDEDTISTTVMRELREKTGTEQVVLVPTGTAANLDLVASFVDAAEDPSKIKFFACTSEHTVNYEAKMLRKAGIVEENISLLPPRVEGDGLMDPATLEASLPREGEFIFQIAIPTGEGVVPPVEDFKTMVALVKERGGKFLLDGARLTNALAHWELDLGDLKELGVDGFTLGTSKKGGLAEVVGIYDQKAAALLPEEAKSYGHTHSKTAPLALVTGAYLNTNLWRTEAKSENDSAKAFASLASEMGLEPQFSVDANMVFLKLSPEILKALEANPAFGGVYDDYGQDHNISRLVFTGFKPAESIRAAADALREALSSTQTSQLTDVATRLEDLAAGQTSNE